MAKAGQLGKQWMRALEKILLHGIKRDIPEKIRLTKNRFYVEELHVFDYANKRVPHPGWLRPLQVGNVIPGAIKFQDKSGNLRFLVINKKTCQKQLNFNLQATEVF